MLTQVRDPQQSLGLPLVDGAGHAQDVLDQITTGRPKTPTRTRTRTPIRTSTRTPARTRTSTRTRTRTTLTRTQAAVITAVTAVAVRHEDTSDPNSVRIKSYAPPTLDHNRIDNVCRERNLLYCNILEDVADISSVQDGGGF